MKRKEQIKEINSQDEGTLKNRLLTLAEELMKLRFRKGTGQLQETHRLKSIRHEIARIKTVLTQKLNREAEAK